MTENMYRVTITGEKKGSIQRMLNMAGLAKSHATDIIEKGGIDLSLDENKANKLKDLGFALFKVITR